MDNTKDAEVLRDEMLEKISDKYQKTEGFPVWEIISGAAYGLKYLWDKIFKVEKLLNVNNLSGSDLDRFVYQRKGLVRKEAVAAVGTLKIISGEGTIPEGSLFSTTGGVMFRSVAEAEVVNGSEISIVAVDPGSSGNVPAEAITEIPVTIPGIYEVTNESQTQDGFDEESNESLRERYYEALREPATCGNIYHYKHWAKSISGVGDAKIFPLWEGANTVQVVIIDENGEPASESLVSTVQEAIDPDMTGEGNGLAPIGAYATVSAAIPLPINVSADITLESGYDSDEVIAEIEDSIDNYLKSIGFDYNFVSAAKICDIVLTTDGVADCENFTANGSFTRIAIPDKDIPVMGEVTLNVVGT